MAKQTKSENLILYICDFRRGVLNVRLYARIQHLLPDHKYRGLDSQTSVSWLLEQISGRICGRRPENEAAWENKIQRIDTEIYRRRTDLQHITTIIRVSVLQKTIS